MANTTQLIDLINLVKTLRGAHGCPWDRKQTAQSIMACLVEEVYELVDAVESGAAADICEELGDVLFHLLFLVDLAEEKGQFSLDAVMTKIHAKMVRRHPHVFGDATVGTPEDVRRQWHTIKQNEKRAASASILSSIPKAMPALMRAYQVSDRAARTGFDWDDLPGVIAKVEEEWAELNDALARKELDAQQQEEALLEFGDLLFTLVNVARFANIHPESALTAATRKFEQRFRLIEDFLVAEGVEFEAVSRERWDRLWERAKTGVANKQNALGREAKGE